MIENTARLRSAKSFLGVDINDMVHVFGKVDNHGHIAALAGETGATSAGENRRTMGSRQRTAVSTSCNMPGNHDADRHLAVVRSVGGIERACSFIKSHFALYCCFSEA